MCIYERACFDAKVAIENGFSDSRVWWVVLNSEYVIDTFYILNSLMGKMYTCAQTNRYASFLYPDLRIKLYFVCDKNLWVCIVYLFWWMYVYKGNNPVVVNKKNRRKSKDEKRNVNKESKKKSKKWPLHTDMAHSLFSI